MTTTLLRGSVRRAGDVIRIAVQLLDAHAGRQIWADRYDVTAGNLFAVQDQIAERIASALAIGVDRTRLRSGATDTAVEPRHVRLLAARLRLPPEGHGGGRRRGAALLRARARVRSRLRARVRRPVAVALQRVELPGLGEVGRDRTPRVRLRSARPQLDDADAMVQVVLGRILLYRRRFDAAAIASSARSALNPNDTDVLVHAGLCRVVSRRRRVGARAGGKGDAAQSRTTAVVPAPLEPGAVRPGARRRGVSRWAHACRRCSSTSRPFLRRPARSPAAIPSAARLLARFLPGSATASPSDATPSRASRCAGCLHVNPFRRDAGRGAARAWFCASRVSKPIPTRAGPRTRVSARRNRAGVTRREGELWTLAFEGAGGAADTPERLQRSRAAARRPGGEMHCLELADRPARDEQPRAVLDERARGAKFRRARASCSTRSTTPTRSHDSARRTGAGRARSDRRDAVRRARARRALPALWQRGGTGAVGGDLADPQRHQEDRQGPSALSAGTSRTPFILAPSASTSPKRPIDWEVWLSAQASRREVRPHAFWETTEVPMCCELSPSLPRTKR